MLFNVFSPIERPNNLQFDPYSTNAIESQKNIDIISASIKNLKEAIKLSKQLNFYNYNPNNFKEFRHQLYSIMNRFAHFQIQEVSLALKLIRIGTKLSKKEASPLDNSFLLQCESFQNHASSLFQNKKYYYSILTMGSTKDKINIRLICNLLSLGLEASSEQELSSIFEQIMKKTELFKGSGLLLFLKNSTSHFHDWLFNDKERIQRLLHTAVDQKNYEITRLLLEKGAKWDERCFIVACEKGFDKAVHAMLDENIIDFQSPIDTEKNRFPFWYICKTLDSSLIMRCIKSNIRLVNQVLDQETLTTPLHILALHDAPIDLMRAFLKLGANVYAQDVRGQTFLHTACISCSISAINLLHEDAPSVVGNLLEIKDKDNNGVLDFAMSRKLNFIQAILQLYVWYKPILTKDEAYLHIQSHDVYRLKDVALKQEFIEYLISFGIDLASDDGIAPLGIALFCGDVKTAEFLISKGSALDRQHPDGYYAFHTVFAENTFCFVQKNVRDLTLKDSNGESLLDNILSTGDPKFTQRVLQDPTTSFKIDSEIIFRLIHTKKEEGLTKKFLHILHSFFPDLTNIEDTFGNSVLHYAVKYGHRKMAGCLIMLGAKVASENHAGKTPIDLCFERKDSSTMKFFHKFVRSSMQIEEKTDYKEAQIELLAKNNCSKILMQIVQREDIYEQRILCALLKARVAKPFYKNVVDDDIKLTEFVQAACELLDKKTGISFHIIDYTLRINHALPLTKETLDTIEHFLKMIPHGDKSSQIKLFIALQTHDDLLEIEKTLGLQQIEIERQLERDIFFTLSREQQLLVLNYAQIYRMRKAAPLAILCLKNNENTDPDVLAMSLKVLKKTATPIKHKHYFDILNKDFSIHLKIMAAHALTNSTIQPQDIQERDALISLLKQSDESLQIALLQALLEYDFSVENERAVDVLCSLHTRSENVELERALAFVLCTIPHEKALLKALSIIESDAWDLFDVQPHRNRDTINGYFDVFAYRPAFCDNRDAMRRSIAERLVSMQLDDMRDEIESEYESYKKSPEKCPELEKIKEAICSLDDQFRNLGFPLFLPENRPLFRGISARKGELMGQVSVVDLFIRGAGGCDLSLLKKKAAGTWAKVNQVFTSKSLSYVTAGNYFTNNGILMLINSNHFNENLLRRQIRIEKESSKLNFVFYKTVPLSAFMKIYASNELRISIESILAKQEIEKSEQTTFLDQQTPFTRKKLHNSLVMHADKVSYYKPEELTKSTTKQEMKRMMNSDNLSDITESDLIEVNIKRQIARLILKHKLHDTPFAPCIEAAMSI